MSAKQRFTLCIDLDDTLIPTAYLYQVANWKCGLIITEAIAPFSMLAEKILKTADDLDIAHAKRFGFDERRFQYSWITAYRKIAAEVGVPVDPRVRRALHRAASGFKKGPFVPFPGVVHTLRLLCEEGHTLQLITAGPVRMQRHKIKASMIGWFFDGITIVDMDKGPVLERFKDSAGDRPVVMVGDSKKSDIVPAIGVGVIPVWLARGVQWSFAHQDVDHDKFHVIQHFRDLPALLRTL